MSGPPILDDLRRQAETCARMGSPFTARVLTLIPDLLPRAGPVGARLLDWHGDHDEVVPICLAGALHGLVLSGAAPDLARAYPPHDPSDEALRSALLAALRDHVEDVAAYLDRPPQTNEVARSGVLIAAAHWLHARHPLPLRLSELGASAGLNLRFDRYAVQAGSIRLGPRDAALTLAPDWTGPPPSPAPVTIAERRGVDLSPIDTSDPSQRLRLRSYVWAGQADRLARLDRALALPPAPVDQGDAAGWLAQRLAQPVRGTLHLVYHTVAWQYFPPATQAACLAALEEAGARATPDAPVAHLSMEGDRTPHGTALTLRLWPGGANFALGRADFHGRWVAWDPRAT